MGTSVTSTVGLRYSGPEHAESNRATAAHRLGRDGRRGFVEELEDFVRLVSTLASPGLAGRSEPS